MIFGGKTIPVTCNGNSRFVISPLNFRHITEMSILAITAHWIDVKFYMQQQLLAFIHIEGSHIGNLLAFKVYQTLDVYNFKEKLFCITADNALNNISIARQLSLLLARESIVWDNEANYIPCFAHIVNLVVQKFLRTVRGRSDEDEGDMHDCNDFTLDAGDNDSDN